jgi:hypothetical protein
VAEGPEQILARSLAAGLRQKFAERDATALALAELVLDGAEVALPLAEGGPPDGALDALELLATRLDLFAWDGPPGWDEVLARGLAKRAPIAPRPAPLDGIGAAPDRAGQHALCVERAREEARRLIALGRAASAPDAALLVSLHGSLSRLVALAVASGPLRLEEDAAAGDLPPPGEDALVREMDERRAAHGDFAGAQEEWLARLLHDNPAAAATPAFRTFFAGLGQSLRVGLSLRGLRDAARAGHTDADLEALIGAVGGWQPVRWMALRKGAPARFWAELFPARAAEPTPHARLASECSAALDALGRLWSARGLSLTAFSSLAAAFTARSASALALWEELG